MSGLPAGSGGSSGGGSDPNAVPSINAVTIVAVCLIGFAMLYALYEIVSTYTRKTPAGEPQAHVVISATMAKLFVGSMSFVAALAINNAMTQTFSELQGDIPLLQSGGPWIYALVAIFIAIGSTYSISKWVQNNQVATPF